MHSGSAGIGSTGYVDCALLNQAIGVTVQDIPYRGGGPAIQDLIGQQFDYFCTLSPTGVPPVQAGLVKGLAVLGRDRLPALPELRTTYEQGLDFAASTWFGFFLPKGTPAPIVKKLHDATAAAINTPAVKEQLLSHGHVRRAAGASIDRLFAKHHRARDREERGAAPRRRHVDRVVRARPPHIDGTIRCAAQPDNT